jgi:hypothetical protein
MSNPLYIEFIPVWEGRFLAARCMRLEKRHFKQ